jgi:hypothetical protein
MALTDVELTVDSGPLPYRVRSFLREAERRIEAFQRHSPVPGFVPSDFEAGFRVLESLSTTFLVPGKLFCEWGSGFGVIACLAAMLDFDAYGIEIEMELVDAAQSLAADYELPVEFVRGSFIPPGAGSPMCDHTAFGWLSTSECGDETTLGLATEDFGVIFAYPWPDEEKFTAELFDEYANAGAVLITYHGETGFRIRRKVSRRKWRR